MNTMTAFKPGDTVGRVGDDDDLGFIIDPPEGWPEPPAGHVVVHWYWSDYGYTSVLQCRAMESVDDLRLIERP